MALLNRSKNQKTVLPEEVNQYYQSQRRERAGVAVILGIVALIVTLLLGLALFYGGRALYNKVNDKEEPKKINTISETTKKEADKSDDKKSDSDSGVIPPDAATPAPAPSTPPTPTTPTTPQPTTPNLGDEEVQPTLPATGDEGM